MTTIPIYQPDLSGRERQYVLECLDSTWISSKGKFIQEFESGFASFVNSPHAVSVCNGTVALHLALLAVGVGPDDEVIVPSLTYIASVNAIKYVGATPVFVDSDPSSWQVDPDSVERKITSRTKAVMAVHLYGGACDIKRLAEICKGRGLHLIEDCAEALGTTVGGQHVGTFGSVATFSFFGNKTLTTGEGGMVIASSLECDSMLRRLRGQGLATNAEYWHDVVGYNYRMTNICAAIGLAQLERIHTILDRKIQLANRYRELLSTTPVTFQESAIDEVSSHWMVTILTPSAADRDPLRAELAAGGVETRPLFHPAHTMPMYLDTRLDLPVAKDLSARGINLPSWHDLPESDLRHICAVVERHEWCSS